MLGIARNSVQYWIITKKLPTKLIEGKNYIRLVDLEKIVYDGSASKQREVNRRMRERIKFLKNGHFNTPKKHKN